MQQPVVSSGQLRLQCFNNPISIQRVELGSASRAEEERVQQLTHRLTELVRQCHADQQRLAKVRSTGRQRYVMVFRLCLKGCHEVNIFPIFLRYPICVAKYCVRGLGAGDRWIRVFRLVSSATVMLEQSA